MTMKAIIPIILRRFGFRQVLTVNAVLSAVFVGVIALFTPTTPLSLIVATLLFGGIFRSLQFTSLNTIAYADLEPRDMSRATPLIAVGQQLSISLGVAIGALAVEAAAAWKGHTAIAADDFGPAFILAAVIAASAAFAFARLPEHAGAEIANRTPAPGDPTDQRMG
jgi:predicted MFS family arabinose efflux permease